MIYEQVKKQQTHFNLFYNGKPRHLEIEEKAFYAEAMSEEVMEYRFAISKSEEYDALLDVIVFATGALLRHGFPEEGIKEVVNANLEKIVGPIKDKRNEFKLDLQKPKGWEPPNLQKVLDLAWAKKIIAEHGPKPKEVITKKRPKFQKGGVVPAPTKPDNCLIKLCENQAELFELEAPKYDDGKPPIHLVDKEIILEIAKVLDYGAKKYSVNSWKKGIKLSRYYSAAQRHFLAWNSGETNDSETGLNHLSHAACNLHFMLYFIKHNPQLDDRKD